MAAQQPSSKSSTQSVVERSKYYDEEAVAEGSDQLLPGYILGEVDLQNLDKTHFPFADFAINYHPIDGIAHLQSKDRVHAPKREEQDIGRPPGWSDRVSFYKEGLGWTKLTFEDAKKIFGEPRLRGMSKTLFYTFDTFVTVQREKQLFHLDLRFDSAGTIESYRIRGIGIRNPTWVSN